MTKTPRNWKRAASAHLHSMSGIVTTRQQAFPRGACGGGRAQRLHPEKSHIGGNKDTSPWLRSRPQSKRTWFRRWEPAPAASALRTHTQRHLPWTYGRVNSEMRLTSSNNLFPFGSILESSRNASSPTKQISCPSYTKKRQKKFGKKTPQKKALVQPVPFLSNTYRVGQNDHLHCGFPWGIQAHQGSQNLLLLPFHQVFQIWQLGENENEKWAGVMHPLRPWSSSALEEISAQPARTREPLVWFFLISNAWGNCWTWYQSHDQNEPKKGEAQGT